MMPNRNFFYFLTRTHTKCNKTTFSVTFQSTIDISLVVLHVEVAVGFVSCVLLLVLFSSLLLDLLVDYTAYFYQQVNRW